MQLSEIINSSQQALRGNPLRTGLTMLGIIIGITSVILISSLGQGAVAFITEELSVFGTNYFQIAPGENAFAAIAGTSNPLTTDDAEAIKNSSISNIESVAPFGFASARISSDFEKTNALVYGLTSEAQIILKPDMVYGDFISDEDDAAHAKVVVLGSDLSEELFGENTNPVGESVRIDDTRFKVVGVTTSTGALTGGFFNNAANIPLSTMITYLTGVDELTEIDISVENEDLLNQTMQDVETFLRDYRDIEEGEDSDFYAQSFKDSLDTIQTVTGLLTLMVSAISGISLVVGGVGVMNIMLVTVTERTREIGLLKAIGAREQDILIQFLIESITLTVAGGFIGIVLGASGAFLIARLAGIPFVISPVTVIMAVVVSTAVGIIFGLYPARRAAKLDPIDALRYE